MMITRWSYVNMCYANLNQNIYTSLSRLSTRLNNLKDTKTIIPQINKGLQFPTMFASLVNISASI